jgi:hypothetical protein
MDQSPQRLLIAKNFFKAFSHALGEGSSLSMNFFMKESRI